MEYAVTEAFNVELIENAMTLLTVGILFAIFFLRLKQYGRKTHILIGICVGFAGILLMWNSVPLAPGLLYDTRSILISVTGLFAGVIPTAIGAGIICLYRLYLGGPGTLAGIITTVLCGATGLVWGRFRFAQLQKLGRPWVWAELYLFGLIVHAVMLLCVLTLPERGMSVLAQIAGPVLLIYPLTSLLLCAIIFTQMDKLNLEAAQREQDVAIGEIFDKATVGILLLENDRVRFANRAFSQITGRAEEELLRANWAAVTHPDDFAQSEAAYQKLRSGQIDSIEMEKRYLRPDGTVVWAHVDVVPVPGNDGARPQNLCIVKDITEIMTARREQEKNEAQLRVLSRQYQENERILVTLLDSVPDLIFYKNSELSYLGCNSAFERFMGTAKAELVGKSDYDLFPPELAARFREQDMEMIREKRPQRYEEDMHEPDGTKVSLDTLKTPYYDEEGNLLGIVGVGRDVTQRKAREDEIQYLNFTTF